MVDTGFYVPEDKLTRLVAPPPSPRPSPWDVTKRQTFLSGGGGIVSTVPDFLRFCQMLLNGGELDGVRILKPETVRLMTTNSLPPDIHIAGHEIGPALGTGWGLGFAIRTHPDFSLIPGSVGVMAGDLITAIGDEPIKSQTLEAAFRRTARFSIREHGSNAARSPNRGHTDR
jgi:CubicO group peptidase (beta-lactamase class C family)